MKNKLIYFDNAATGYPKPECVVRETLRAFRDCGGNPGRSGHKLSIEASKAIYECRKEVCELLGVNTPERVVFTPNATYALNLAIKGLAENDSHIVISDLEHNSVIRPVHALSKNINRNIRYSMFSAATDNNERIVENFVSQLCDDTKLAVITAASNICGKIPPLEKISEICREKGIRLIVDASQALGEIDFDMNVIMADAVCCAGHKALYGPTGTGFVVFSKDAVPESIIEGGNGVRSYEAEMSGELPERLEAGTLNTFGICGLYKGIRFIRNLGIDNIRQSTSQLCRYISDGLLERGARVYGDFKNKTPVILFNIPGKSCDEVAEYLDENGICVRSGLHCAPTAHKALGSSETGAVRVSLGYGNTKKEADRFLKIIDEYIENEI